MSQFRKIWTQSKRCLDQFQFTFGTPKAKAKTRTRWARTARTRKAKAIKHDLWTMLDRRKNPKPRQEHLSWERLVRRKAFNSLSQWNRESAESTSYVKCNLAAVTAFRLDVHGNRPEPKRHRKGYITASGERIPDFGGARLNCTDELDVNTSSTSRYTDVWKILANSSHILQQLKTLLVVEWRRRLHRSTRWCDWTPQAEMNRLTQRYGRKTLVLVYQENVVYNFQPGSA